MSQMGEEKALRILEMYRRLVAGRTLFTSELAREFNVSVRTIQRDMNLLESVVPIDKVTLAGRKGYRIYEGDRKTRVIRMEVCVSDLVALFFASRFLGAFAGTGLHEYISEHLEKILGSVGDVMSAYERDHKRKFYFLADFARDYSGMEDVFNEVVSALLRNQKLWILHRRPGMKEAVEHVVEPYTLAVYRHGLYLAGASDRAGGSVRIFALERIEDARRLRDKTFRYPPDWDPEKFFSEFGLTEYERTDVVLEFLHPRYKDYLARRRWPYGADITEEDGRIVFRATIDCTAEFENWLLGFGVDVRVVEPDWLKERLIRRLKDTLALYGPA